MLANRVRMGVYSEVLPIYLLQSGTDSYLNWDIYSDEYIDYPSYSNSDFIELFGVPYMDWGGEAALYNINRGNRNWLEVTFSYSLQNPPSFSEPETVLFDISSWPKTIDELRFHAYFNGWVRLNYDHNDQYLLPDMDTFTTVEMYIRLYSICLKRGE